MEVIQLVEVLELKIRSRNSNNNEAAKIFREAGCIHNDYRTEKIINNTIDYLQKKFTKDNGRTKLTAASMGVGKITAITLGIDEPNERQQLRLGNFILDVYLDNGMMELTRDDFRTGTDIISRYQGKKTKYRANTFPYYLEVKDFLVAPTVPSSLHRSRPPLWSNWTRKIEGERKNLVKTREELPRLYGDEEFLDAVNALEGVKFAINSKIAHLSSIRQAELTDTMLELTDKEGVRVPFDSRDIKREKQNSHLLGKDLFKNDFVFEPHRGKQSRSDEMEKEVKRLQNKVDKVKLPKTKLRYQLELDTAIQVAEIHIRNWTSKKLCLKTSSKAMRNNAILCRVNGDEDSEGWLDKTFYYSYFLDYRGRVYTHESYLSTQSNDVAKAHIMFAKGKVLDQAGLESLMVNAANAWNKDLTVEDFSKFETDIDYISHLKKEGLPSLSLDKLSLKDRFNYISDHLEELRDICEHDGDTKLWNELDKPYLFMSYAYEIIGAFDAIIEGEDYETSVITYIDGMNNGTQHLAAMAKDEQAGSYVGLTDLEIPKDLYVADAKRVIEMNQGTLLGDKLNKMPMSSVRKSIAKRPVMIIAYSAGVMRLGSTVYQDSYESGDLEKYGLSKADTAKLGKDIMKAYTEVCTGPVKVMMYLRELSKYALNEMEKTTVGWETPTGFPVVVAKPYSENNKIMAYLQNKQVGHIFKRYLPDVPLKAAITTSVPANFVHSYDAAHLSKVVVSSSQQGIDMAVVHDSFGAHPNDMNNLLNIAKNEFIKIYEKNVLVDAKYYIVGNNSDIIFEDYGNLSLEEIWLSEYFFC